MQIVTYEYTGMKCLTKMPSYLNKVVFPKDAKVVMIELGTLGNFKRFMRRYKAVKGFSMSTSGKAFSGVETYDDYLELLDNGDEEVIKKIKIETNTQVKALSKKYEDTFTKYKFEVTGEFFDIGLVLSGVPECWLEPENKSKAKVQVEIIINGTFHAGIKPAQIVKSTAKILAITKILETHDVQVKIKIVSVIRNYSTGESTYITIATDVKDYDEPINYKKCSALLSPTYLRRGGFKVMELCAKSKLLNSYGGQMRSSDNSLIELQHDKDIAALEKRLFKKDK